MRDDARRIHDVIVVGGGITGISAAFALVEAGADVLILDAGVNAGSTANAGSLHVQLQSRFLRLFPEQAPNVEASLPLYLAAVDAWHRMSDQLGGVELSQNGGLMIAENADQLAFLEQKAEREARKGLDVDILGRDDLHRIAPYLGEDAFGAELCRDEGKLNPLVANLKLRKHLADLGVTSRRGKVTAIRSGQGFIEVEAGIGFCARKVVIAAAWGTKTLASGLSANIPVAHEPLHMNITEPVAYEIGHLVQHAERSITFKQLSSGQIVIGGGWPAALSPTEIIPGVLEDSLLGNIALAGRMVPGIAGLRLLRTWAGLNTTADGKTILGPLPYHGNVVVAVPGDAGYTLGPLVGKAAAAIALGQDPGFDTAPYRPDRFSDRS